MVSCMKNKNSLKEHKRKDKVQRENTCQNLKRHIPPVSLFLYYKMIAIHSLFWSLVLRLVLLATADEIFLVMEKTFVVIVLVASGCGMLGSACYNCLDSY